MLNWGQLTGAELLSHSLCSHFPDVTGALGSECHYRDTFESSLTSLIPASLHHPEQAHGAGTVSPISPMRKPGPRSVAVLACKASYPLSLKGKWGGGRGWVQLLIFTACSPLPSQLS